MSLKLMWISRKNFRYSEMGKRLHAIENYSWKIQGMNFFFCQVGLALRTPPVLSYMFDYTISTEHVSAIGVDELSLLSSDLQRKKFTKVSSEVTVWFTCSKSCKQIGHEKCIATKFGERCTCPSMSGGVVGISLGTPLSSLTLYMND